ncbi:PTS ascorbate transporter subunit IIC [Hydrogenibacillus sp. N12]|uniref:PTS ascorbate transporter subunit IIC n=1 Tax=Hydrogenibacillus sp. N12 TaxID=2866627 RepID=UPI001C7DB23F|nr:PTS ascorbate transporter subunit IIC [Hydrogenibacillus sp. N12]QZA32171.1 PTS ascorbate transporter subunit IIC [Hydrogenibacillus sp. N12]
MAIVGQFVKDVLSQPAILVGLVALLGLIVQRKPVGDVITGTVKTILGFVILGAGANTLVGSLDKLSPLLEAGFGVRGVVPNNEAIVAIAQNTLGRETALIMVFGLVANLLIARLTPLKYVFLTGHHTFFMAALLSAVLGTAGLSGAVLVLVGSFVLGVLMVLMPAMADTYMQRVTGGQPIALGHFGTLGYWLAGFIGSKVGKAEDSIEQYRLPSTLSFFRDSLVATAVVMLVVFAVSVVAAGDKAVELAGDQNVWAFALTQSLGFTAGVAIILQGVRLIISEIVPAFQGIAARIVPEARPALDCPVTFPHAPTAVLVGFISSFVGGLMSMLALAAAGLPVIVPGLVPHFFVGGTAGVFGNATGGRRGCVVGAFVNGILITVGAALLLPTLGALGFANTTFGDSDFQWVGILIGAAGKVFGQSPMVLAAVVVVAFAFLLGLGAISTRRRRDMSATGVSA